jgi:preprotein translocase subunit SecD
LVSGDFLQHQRVVLVTVSLTTALNAAIGEPGKPGKHDEDIVAWRPLALCWRFCPKERKRSIMQKHIFIAAIAAILTACAEPERATRTTAPESRAIILEIRMVDDTPEALESALAGAVPDDRELYRGNDLLPPLLLKKQVEISSAHLQDAQLAFNQEYQFAIHLSLNAEGQRIFCALTRQNIGKRAAILFIEEGKGKVAVAPFIRAEVCGGDLQITGGHMSHAEANQIAQRLRSGISAGK